MQDFETVEKVHFNMQLAQQPGMLPGSQANQPLVLAPDQASSWHTRGPRTSFWKDSEKERLRTTKRSQPLTLSLMLPLRNIVGSHLGQKHKCGEAWGGGGWV